LKDRLYTFHKESPLRRGSQTVLLEVVVALTKLMAPILSFTAEELWRNLPEVARGTASSVHLASFPQADPRWDDSALAQRWEQLLKIRESVQAALEAKRRDKVIGSSLEAKVLIEANPDRFDFLKTYEKDLPAVFIVSKVELIRVTNLPHHPDFDVKVFKADGSKCERCWNYRDTVGKDPEHPTLCDRCLEAIR
jgi:isoleucyl-tRNA synthetase